MSSTDGKDKTKEFNELPEKKVSKIKKSDKVKQLADAIKDEYGIDVELAKNVKYKIEKVIDFLNNKYDFRYNVINTDTEYRLKVDPGKKENEFLYFDDRDYRAVFIDMKLNNINISAQDFKDIVYGKNVSVDYNPFKEYIFSLPKWDGVFDKKENRVTSGRDYIREFCAQVYLTEENQREYFVEGFRKWFTALVCSLVVDVPSAYYINQTCLVIVGGQGKYKTTWIKNIVPPSMQLKYFYGSTFDSHNKDHEKYLAYKIIINLDEMAALNRTDIESLKSRITQDQVVTRLPYAKADIHLKRRASFAGTQNNVEFQRDDTGSRRWLTYEIDRIVIDDKFDVDLMYAQALALFSSGYQYWFDSADIKKVEKHNEKFQLKGFEMELVQRYFSIPTEDEMNEKSVTIRYLTATDIANLLAANNKNINVNNTVIKNIGTALSKLGFIKRSCRLPGKNYSVPLWCVKEELEPNTSYPDHLEKEVYDPPI